jgi:hypothetical protein
MLEQCFRQVPSGASMEMHLGRTQGEIGWARTLSSAMPCSFSPLLPRVQPAHSCVSLWMKASRT